MIFYGFCEDLELVPNRFMWKETNMSTGFKHLSQIKVIKQQGGLKFMFFEKSTKIDEIFSDNLMLCSYCQIVGEDFVDFCGLLRKHELQLGQLFNYCKVASSNMIRLEAHAGFFRMLIQGIFYPYVL